MNNFTHAIIKKPAENFSAGLTTVSLGIPDFKLVLKQHDEYRRTLVNCGLELTVLEPDIRFPDSTFVEDAAVITSKRAIITNPGADSRKGEIEDIKNCLGKFFRDIRTIDSPGTMDGGDICEAGDHYFIGISNRTNEEGARQLAAYLAEEGYSSSFVDIRGLRSILHLKSGLAWLGEKYLVVIDELQRFEQFSGFRKLIVENEEQYAANCVRINETILIAAGYPQFAESLKKQGYTTLALDMSEFQKMDGGLSCLSLRFRI